MDSLIIYAICLIYLFALYILVLFYGPCGLKGLRHPMHPQVGGDLFLLSQSVCTWLTGAALHNASAEQGRRRRWARLRP